MHFFLDYILKYSVCLSDSNTSLAVIQIFKELRFGSVADEGIAATYVEVDVGQRVESEVFGTTVNVDNGHHFQEQSQFGYLCGLNHYVNAIEIAQDYRLEDEILDVGAVSVGDFGKFLLEFRRILAVELLHTVYADFIERFEDIHRRKEKCTRATCRVKYRYFLQSMIEPPHKPAVAPRDKVGCKCADVEIVGDKIVYRGDFSTVDFAKYITATLQAVDRLSPNLIGQSPLFGSAGVPIRTEFGEGNVAVGQVAHRSFGILLTHVISDDAMGD